MKILVVNPNTSVEMTARIDGIAKKHTLPDTRIVTVCSAEGPRSIESAYEESLVARRCSRGSSRGTNRGSTPL